MRCREERSRARHRDARGAAGALARLGQAETAEPARVERKQRCRSDAAAARDRQAGGAAGPTAVDGGGGAEAVIPASDRVDEDIAGGQRAARIADRNAGAAPASVATCAARVDVAEAIGFDRDPLGAYAAAGDRQAGGAALRIAGQRVGRARCRDGERGGRRERPSGDVYRGVARRAATAARLDREASRRAAGLIGADRNRRAGVADESPAAFDEELTFR